MVSPVRFGHAQPMQTVRFGNGGDNPDKPGNGSNDADKEVKNLLEEAGDVARRFGEDLAFRLAFLMPEGQDVLEEAKTKGKKTLDDLQGKVQNPQDLQDPNKAKALADDLKKSVEDLQNDGSLSRAQSLAEAARDAVQQSFASIQGDVDQLKQKGRAMGDKVKQGGQLPSDVGSLRDVLEGALPDQLKALLPDLFNPADKPDGQDGNDGNSNDDDTK